MASALITGITGQDGSYLAEFLAAKNYRVIGATRSVEQAGRSLPASLAGRIELVAWDMSDESRMTEILAAERPDEFYNFAAYSSGQGMFDNPTAIGDVNGLAVSRMLEAIRAAGSGIRFCQAASSELFGEAAQSPQSEETPFRPRSPYGAAKLYAHAMIRIYRRRYGLHASSAILFNHESPRRGMNFVTRKIANAAARIKLGLAQELHLGNLEARRDWGFSKDYVRAMWLMAQAPVADDYVVGTGVTHSVREFCERAFGCLGLDYRSYVREDAAMHRPPESFTLVADATKLRQRLGWAPEVTFDGLVEMMVQAELSANS